MCEVLDRAINEGRCEGLISVCKDFKLSYEQTAAELKEKFQLSDQEIEKHETILVIGVRDHGAKAVEIFEVNGRFKGEDDVWGNPGWGQASFGK